MKTSWAISWLLGGLLIVELSSEVAGPLVRAGISRAGSNVVSTAAAAPWSSVGGDIKAPSDTRQIASPAGNTPRTASGVPLPAGWSLKQRDHFGKSGNIRDAAALSDRYYEGQYYNRDKDGKVRIPNVVINDEQQTYRHFDNANVFSFKEDRLTIQARGKPDGSVDSGEIVSKYVARSWCVEARYTIPAADKSWPAFWQYAAVETGNTGAEVDFEHPVSDKETVHDVSLYNHGAKEQDIKIFDPRFSIDLMRFSDLSFDASASPHTYTSCYDDAASLLSRYIDGKPVYSARWKWLGPDATTIVNLAVGGKWPGKHLNPSAYAGDLHLYSLEYFGP